MTIQEAIAKAVPILRDSLKDNLNDKNNKRLRRSYKLNTDYLQANPTYWKYPHVKSRTLVNSLKVAQLRGGIVVKTVDYGLFLETGTKRNGKPAIRPKRPWFADAVNLTFEKKLSDEIANALADEIILSLR
jgi:hypothetical protein